MATPAANRRKDVFAGQPPQLQNSTLMQHDLEEVHASSCTGVPVSAIKPPAGVIEDSNPRPKKRLMATVEQTPTRGPSKYSNLTVGASTEVAPSSRKNPMVPPSVVVTGLWTTEQLPPWTDGLHCTPSRKVLTGPKASEPRSGVESTPMKPLRSVSENLTATSNSMTNSPASNGGDVSIYKNLGWDDDVDELM